MSPRPRRLILRNYWSPGDIIMLTAAVRDLHRHNPGRFLTDVRTSCAELWENNPHVTPLRDKSRSVEVIDCEYPLIDQSNSRPLHCLHGFGEFLGRRLEVPCHLTECRGDLHLSAAEKRVPGPVQHRLRLPLPYWIVVAGGKFDYTIKWWSHARYQAVVDHFRGRLLFVQVGDVAHHHPPLEGVLDLRGRTSLRQLLVLVYRAAGILCPVTSLMHFAAAVETPPGGPRLRPCVVVAGGREPPHWEAYPGHQFIHTVGALPCCSHGGCWRARTFPLGDGDEIRDAPNRLCLDVVDDLPRCMDLIAAEDVIRRIELYLADDYQGGQLARPQWLAAMAAHPSLKRPGRQRIQPGREREILPVDSHCRMPDLVELRTPAPPTSELGAGRSASGAAPGSGAVVNPPGPARLPRITLCVFASGRPGGRLLACLAAIRRRLPRASYLLRVAAGGVAEAERKHLLRLRARRKLDALHLGPLTLDRTALIQRLLRDQIATEFVWLLDDSAPIPEAPFWQDALAVAAGSASNTVLWCESHPLPPRVADEGAFDAAAHARSARWYRGRPIQPPSAAGTFRSAPSPGARLLVRTRALRALAWPDVQVPGSAHEWMLTEAIRQQGWHCARLPTAERAVPR